MMKYLHTFNVCIILYKTLSIFKGTEFDRFSNITIQELIV